MACLAIAVITYTGSLLVAFLCGLRVARVLVARPQLVTRDWVEDAIRTEFYEPFDSDPAPAAEDW